MDVSLTEPESRFYSELFQCCDVENTGKVPILKATELFRSADISNDAVIEVGFQTHPPPIDDPFISRSRFL